jgi:hypothetical protein
VRASTSLATVTPRGTSSRTNSTKAVAIVASVATITNAAMRRSRTVQPLTSAAAMPRIGVISGASSIAAMTRAPELRYSPSVAITTDSSRKVVKRPQ